MFPKTSAFFRKHVLSDFWGIKAILKHIYIYILFSYKKKHPDLDPTDLGLVFGILIYVDDDAGDNDDDDDDGGGGDDAP